MLQGDLPDLLAASLENHGSPVGHVSPLPPLWEVANNRLCRWAQMWPCERLTGRTEICLLPT